MSTILYLQARYEHLLKREKTKKCVQNGENGSGEKVEDVFFEKDLDAALDSFDNLFCRRCLVSTCTYLTNVALQLLCFESLML